MSNGVIYGALIGAVIGLVVLLMTTIARAEQLNAITTEMEQVSGVKGAFWHTSPLNG